MTKNGMSSDTCGNVDELRGIQVGESIYALCFHICKVLNYGKLRGKRKETMENWGEKLREERRKGGRMGKKENWADNSVYPSNQLVHISQVFHVSSG